MLINYMHFKYYTYITNAQYLSKSVKKVEIKRETTRSRENENRNIGLQKSVW